MILLKVFEKQAKRFSDSLLVKIYKFTIYEYECHFYLYNEAVMIF